MPGDGLTGELGNLLAPALAALFTAAFASSEVPAAWKSSTVISLYKKGDPMNVANCRPVAVGVPLARLYARIFSARLSPYRESQHLRAGFKQVSARIALLVTICLLYNT